MWLCERRQLLCVCCLLLLHTLSPSAQLLFVRMATRSHVQQHHASRIQAPAPSLSHLPPQRVEACARFFGDWSFSNCLHFWVPPHPLAQMFGFGLGVRQAVTQACTDKQRHTRTMGVCWCQRFSSRNFLELLSLRLLARRVVIASKRRWLLLIGLLFSGSWCVLWHVGEIIQIRFVETRV